MLNVGLIGAGRIAGVHARAIQANPDSRLLAVSDVNVENATALGETYSCRTASTDELLHDPDIDAVLIASSTDTHADLIEMATLRGKAVLCEKPVDLSLARAFQCMNATEECQKPIMIGFNRRFDPNFRYLEQEMNAGAIGVVEMVTLTSFDPAPPPISYIKVSGGIFRDMMIHDFDMCHFLMGSLPETITATAACLVDQAIGDAGDYDTAVVTMTYKDGRIATIKNSRRAPYGYDQRIEVLGSKGLLEANNQLEHAVVKSTEQGVTSAKPTYFFLERYMQSYQNEWDAFVNSLKNDVAVPVSLSDGVMALACSEAALLSLQSNRPVALQEILNQI